MHSVICGQTHNWHDAGALTQIFQRFNYSRCGNGYRMCELSSKPLVMSQMCNESYSGITDSLISVNPQLKSDRTPCSVAGAETSAEQPSHQRGRTPFGKERSRLQQQLFHRHPPGSVRWTQWMSELHLIGFTKAEAASALSTSPLVLCSVADGRAQKFQHTISYLMSTTSLAARDMVYMAKQQPLLILSDVVGVAYMCSWFKDKLALDPRQLGSILYRKPNVTMFRASGLQDRMDMLAGLGLHPEDIKTCWLRTPGLLKVSCATMRKKFRILKDLFKTSEVAVLKDLPNALLRSERVFQERVLFLRHLHNVSPSLPSINCCDTDLVFAHRKVRHHLRHLSKTFPRLCLELQQLPGMASVMENCRFTPETMTEHQYFQAFVKRFLTQESWHASHPEVKSQQHGLKKDLDFNLSDKARFSRVTADDCCMQYC